MQENAKNIIVYLEFSRSGFMLCLSLFLYIPAIAQNIYLSFEEGFLIFFAFA